MALMNALLDSADLAAGVKCLDIVYPPIEIPKQKFLFCLSFMNWPMFPYTRPGGSFQESGSPTPESDSQNLFSRSAQGSRQVGI